MHPVKVERENKIFRKPKGWNEDRDGPCGNLSIRREIICDRLHLFSNWRPSAEDLVILNAGGVIELCCIGSQPPVALSVIAGVAE